MGQVVTNAPLLIDKEKIPELSFPHEEVLSAPNQISKRLIDLKSAHELGDMAQYKVRILFADTTGKKRVETTIWDLTKKEVILKYGVKIPICRIYRVAFP